MIRSMTGYGRGDCFLYSRKCTVEIKSVNHRYNDLTIKLPRVMNAFEDKVRKKIGAEIARGKTDVYISFETFSKEDVKINLNTALADAYVDELLAIKQRYALTSDIDIRTVAMFPDIINIDRNMADEKTISEMWETLDQAVSAALSQFVQMRRTEGESLKQNILEKRALIFTLIHKIGERAPVVAADYGDRLRSRLAEAFSDPRIDESRLLQEVAVFADKACIDEELTRLTSHMAQLSDILDEPDAIGRKLDFLVQEINREVNTIGSKSNDLETAKIVVELKSEVEKIREQVQNIE